MKFLLNNEQVTFNVFQSMKQPEDMYVISMIDTIGKDELVVSIEERFNI